MLGLNEVEALLGKIEGHIESISTDKYYHTKNFKSDTGDEYNVVVFHNIDAYTDFLDVIEGIVGNDFDSLFEYFGEHVYDLDLGNKKEEMQDLLYDIFGNAYIKEDLIECDSCGSVYSPFGAGIKINDKSLCLSCVAPEDKKELLETFVNNYKNVNTYFTDEELVELGFVKVSNVDFVYRGVDFDVDPEEVLKVINQKYDKVIFSLEYYEEGHVEYSVWAKVD